LAIAFAQVPTPQAVFVLGWAKPKSDYFKLSHEAGAGHSNYDFW
jgi:hypothetical protein